MNKPEFIAAVSEKAGLSRKDTERVINAALDTITAALVKGEKGTDVVITVDREGSELTFTVTRLLRLAEKKLDGGKSYTICGSQSASDATITLVKEEPPRD